MYASLRCPAALALLTLLLAACAAPQRSAPTQAPMPTQPPLANDAISTVTQVSAPTRYSAPFDATPSPDGALVYFTAEGEGGGMVLRVSPGGEAEALAQGAPLVAPRGLDISGDGSTLYVADEAVASDVGAGLVFALPAAGGAAVALPGADGYRPRALTVAVEAGAEVLYITGSHPDDGRPVLLRLPLGQGEPTVVAAGPPLVEPSGVTAASDGALYVADRSAAGEGRGSLFRVRGSTVEQIATNFLTEGPIVGIALTGDERAILVSSLAEPARSAQALIVDLATLAQARFDKVIGANSGAGGLQRAANADVFAWADSTLPGRSRPAGGGGVYTLSP
jgi:hypothetical protein